MNLKNLAFLFAAAAASSAPAAVDTVWWDVDPTQTVRRVVADSGFPTADELRDATHVVETNRPPATYAMSDVFLASWDGAAVFRPSARVGDAYTWTYGGMTFAWETNVWTLAGAVEGEVLAKPAASNATSVAFGAFGGVQYTMSPRYASYSVVTSTVLKSANDYTDRQASSALTTVMALAGTIESNAVNAATQYVKAAPVEIPAGCTDVDKHGCVHNAPVELGQGAKASVDLSGLNNATCRVVSVAIGPGADASNPDNPSMQQGIAVGNQARAKGTNAIAIGAGVKHEDEDDLTGDNAYAGANEAIAGGYSAKATAIAAVAWGSRAKATAQYAWQLGEGYNTVAKSLKFREWLLLDARGQIPVERLADAADEIADEIAGGMLSQLERLVSPGNMAVVYGGDDDQRIEPRLDGVCDVLMQPDTNGVWMAGAEAYVEPPLGSRNYDLVITNIPQAYQWDRSGEEPTLVPLPEDQNFLLDFSELPREITPTLRCAMSVGYVRGRSMVITNAPLVVRMRQPATNRVVVVVKPWDEMEL